MISTFPWQLQVFFFVALSVFAFIYAFRAIRFCINLMRGKEEQEFYDDYHKEQE